MKMWTIFLLGPMALGLLGFFTGGLFTAAVNFFGGLFVFAIFILFMNILH